MSEDYRIRFLVVDDEQSIRKLCVTIGNSLGFVSAQVRWVRDGRIGLSFAGTKE